MLWLSEAVIFIVLFSTGLVYKIFAFTWAFHALFWRIYVLRHWRLRLVIVLFNTPFFTESLYTSLLSLVKNLLLVYYESFVEFIYIVVELIGYFFR